MRGEYGNLDLMFVVVIFVFFFVFLFDRHTLPGVGGQIDFLRGAALCVDGLGKPILALNSVTKKGETKIVPFLKQGEIIGESSEYISILGYFKTPGLT